MSRILSPKNDYVFKLLFTKDTESLRDLINGVLELSDDKKICSVDIKNPGILPDDIQKKFIVLDIRAVDDSGKEYDIEIQVRRFAAYPERALYYLCRLISDQLTSGQDYHDLTPVIGIHFLDYEQFPENPNAAYTFELRDNQYPELLLTDLLTLHIFELPGIGKDISEKIAKPPCEWFSFLNHAHEEREETMKQHYKNPQIHKAFDVLKTLSADEIVRREAETRERSLVGEAILMSGERKKGRAEGIREGIKKGIKKGIKEHAIETARRMLARGMGTLEIAELTELDREEIEEIRRTISSGSR